MRPLVGLLLWREPTILCGTRKLKTEAAAEASFEAGLQAFEVSLLLVVHGATSGSQISVFDRNSKKFENHPASHSVFTKPEPTGEEAEF